jgi:pimeloyl-ACP methyl ester carboxylesterase
VLTPDLRGHGENRNPFPGGRARADAFAPEFAAAVDFLRSSALVDGSHIAVMGHSMGAAAALDFATRDSGLDAAVLISGGFAMLGPQRPPNALFLHATGDPARIPERTSRLAAKLAGVAEATLGETYGDFRQGTAVRRVEVPDADHLTIVWSDVALREILAFLDASFRRAAPSALPPADPRGSVVALLGVLMALALPGLGLGLGRLVPSGAPLPAGRRGLGLAALAAALLASLPLAAPGRPGAIVALEVGDVVVIQLGLAGLALLVAVFLRDREAFASLFAAPARSLLGAALGLVAVYMLMQPFGTFVHRITLTPERLAAFAAATAGFLPLALALQALLRRGPPLSAALWSLAGRAAVLSALFLGVRVGVLPPVVLLMLPSLAVIFALAELLASSLYAASRNRLAIAAIDAAWLALGIASSMPIRI